MVSTTSPSFSTISSSDQDEQLAALKLLKNELIGHNDRKSAAIEQGVVPRLLAILSNPNSLFAVRSQAAIVLASLAYGNSIGENPIQFNQTLQVLLHCIANETTNSALITPCLRALSIMVASGLPTISILSGPVLNAMTSILHTIGLNSKASSIQQATLIASLLATCCDNGMADEGLDEYGILDSLIDITINLTRLGKHKTDLNGLQVRLMENVLAAIAALTREHGPRCTAVAAAGRLSEYRCASDDNPMLTTLLYMVKDDSNAIRLGAASCITNVYRAGSAPRKYHQDIALIVLPILVRLFDESTDLKSKAPLVLTYLVTDSDDMQKAACDAGAVKKLAGILQRTSDISESLADRLTHEKIVESALLALAAITLFKDDYRQQVIDAKVVPLIVTAMSHPSANVRAAACQCTRSLSRSVCVLRTSLVDAGIAPAIFMLMSDENMKVKTSACAAVCNLVLDFSPMRKAIIDSGVLKLLCEQAQSLDAELRLNAVWALKHLVYAAETEVKEAVLRELSPELLLRLCDDPVLGVEEQALDVIRNLVCGKQENIDTLFEGVGVSVLMGLIRRKLLSSYGEIVIAAVYSVVHLASGSERHRNIIMEHGDILRALHSHMSHPSSEARLGVVWTIINLTWSDDEMYMSARRDRIQALQSMGFMEELQNMTTDPSLDIRERVKTALAQMAQ